MTEEKVDQIIRCVKECWWRVLLVIAIPALLIASLLNGWPVRIEMESGAAAWAQACVSFFAIIAAFMIGGAQQRAELRRRSQDQKDQLNALLETISSCEEQVSYIAERLEDPSRSIENKLSFCLRWESLLLTYSTSIKAVPFHLPPFAFLSINALPAIYDLDRCIGILNELGGLDIPRVAGDAVAREKLVNSSGNAMNSKH
ncbi:hypothetical protein L1889_18055 [Paenalcaligenes niemegkensis]|uniref:hypothetical protein n=1 Tax=Paenalcaligenes niemegkensis TaxID=2895469 RepID=UPI001EE97202|nr:hypothetical protein [Paenalcaligenes niemegkensis]MCQ9618344.1 hypothetical protein [Paenalcaligenes niemegkensis]